MDEKTPLPSWSGRFVKAVCPPHLFEEIEGDLLEVYHQDIVAHGKRRAKRKLIWNTFRYLRTAILLRHRLTHPLTQTYMIRNNIKIAFRNFGRQKSFTLLNIIGLSLGMAASLLILQYVKYERSFDAFHTRAKDTYRIQYNGWQNGQLNFESAVAVPATVPALKNNFPEVEEYTRFLPVQGVIQYHKPGEDPVALREERGLFADTLMFHIFDFKLIEGDPVTCLKGINKIIITQSLARRFFDREDPVGRQLTFNGEDLLDVTGVLEDVPENSHLKFDYLISYETINSKTKDQSHTSWGWYDFYCFVLLKPGTNVKALQSKWDSFVAKTRKENWEKQSSKQEFILQPLTDIHLTSHLLYETSPQDLRDGKSVYALSVIAFFILVIAWVNFVNLSTARAMKRAGEVGIRKVVGALRSQLITQFITESILLNALSGLVALGMVFALWSSFSALTGWNIPFHYLLQRDFWLLVGGLFLVGAILSGFYPAIVLSSFKPVSVLKGKLIQSTGGQYLRKGLVVFQFVASVVLISGSLIVYEQLRFMKDGDLGVSLDRTLVLKGAEVVVDSLFDKSQDAFKNEVLRIPGVKGITGSSNVPGVENYWTTVVRRLHGGPEGTNVVTHMATDYDFVPQYQIKIIAGRNFDRSFPNDRRKMLINRSLASQLEFKDFKTAIGEKLLSGRDTVEIVGVLEDFHQMSKKTAIIPLACRLRPHVGSYYSLKIETSNYKNLVAAIEKPWKEFFPGNPIDYFFLDQFFNYQYARDDRFGEAFALFTSLAILIASLGLVGLASFMTAQRTREIGIRKVLGSDTSGIVLLLSRGFMQPVAISIALACPLGWWLMDRWLQSFPYHIEVPLWTFLISGILVVVVAFVSVSSQTLKAAMTRPAETLKYE